MSIVYLSLGSNLGDRNHFIDCAICEIDKRIGEVTKVSNRYETEPWGFISENKFINVAVEVKTKLSASETSVIIHKIEDELGRKRDINSNGYEDRVIDIDILMFDNIISNNESLTLPHPKMHLREFVIAPLREIAPEIIHPVLGIAIKDIKL
ncbi:MAG: 2-amino-4-hydroxy-6-hydroxymethyldihydropteridine diphosphokinase [Bacteroidales bacterium]|nr:2-amino-4-hydroxy-6-hydroxymethyldihydropteridine diphosphokinase [Bacteroidales bacterium]MBR2475881.1 2-amino-4-hydroxy-6-hydroxymethyldihydropteridine diphosphokinase [Bacteroidaceae bacterium]MBR3608417.1 2-amino-4-hydroxy-6-hydroxymethyldihydropteridine diphosphokinase [Bacteroidales bacterium]